MPAIKLIPMHKPAPSQLAELQRVCDGAPGYFMTCEGKLAEPDQAASWFDGHYLPPGYSEDDHFAFGIAVNGVIAGAATILRGWKRPDQSIVGLLLLAEKYQGQGIGATAYGLLEDVIRGWPGMRSVRIGVNELNAPAFPFWHKMGFRENGERHRLDKFVGDIIILEKPLP